MPTRGPLKYRELVRRLKPFGVVVLEGRGKGSERILLRPDSPGSRRGPQIAIKHHGDNTEIYLPVIQAVLRRFGIAAEDFWQT